MRKCTHNPWEVCGGLEEQKGRGGKAEADIFVTINRGAGLVGRY